ncbi:exodeoxyribonuclease III [Acidisphaera sp. L21]|uniref:exodeoxyribonuclease III n=1 Tax=Acidisphaera sp. L21 TaxID=1641851 RepID=UPI00131AAC69|nr:exodeoxyribonuclease III [Acidisphaera sp. L21]
MKIATWNVNSVRIREPHVCRWLQRVEPDVLLLQEIKCEEKQFPAPAFKALGYDSVVAGQKSYNGVAILSRIPLDVHHVTLPGLPPEDAQARYLEIAAAGVTIGNLYLPNGNSGGEAGFAYKMAWMDRLADRAQALLDSDTPFVLAGDYNVAPADVDYATGTLPTDDALVRPETRARFRRMLWAGLTDAVRVTTPTGPIYTFWDYQGGAFQRDRGLRIDHALLSPVMADRLISAAPDKNVRAEDQPSDHVPVLVTFED